MLCSKIMIADKCKYKICSFHEEKLREIVHSAITCTSFRSESTSSSIRNDGPFRSAANGEWEEKQPFFSESSGRVTSSQGDTTMETTLRMERKRFSPNRKQSFQPALALISTGLQKERGGGVIFILFIFHLQWSWKGLSFSQFHFSHAMNMGAMKRVVVPGQHYHHCR